MARDHKRCIEVRLCWNLSVALSVANKNYLWHCIRKIDSCISCAAVEKASEMLWTLNFYPSAAYASDKKHIGVQRYFFFLPQYSKRLSVRFSVETNNSSTARSFSVGMLRVLLLRIGKASRASGCPPNTLFAGRSPHPLSLQLNTKKIPSINNFAVVWAPFRRERKLGLQPSCNRRCWFGYHWNNNTDNSITQYLI